MIRHTASAFVAAALVSAFAGNPAYAQQKVEGTMTHEMGHYLGLDHTLTNKNSGVEAKTKAPKDLAARKGMPQAGAVLPHPIRDYALSANNSLKDAC